MILTPGHNPYRRPQGPVRINYSSEQSDGLYRWWPVTRSTIGGGGPQLRVSEICTGASMAATGANTTPRLWTGIGYHGAKPLDGEPFPDLNTWGMYTANNQPTLPMSVTLAGWFNLNDVATTRAIIWHELDDTNTGWRLGTSTSAELQWVIGGVAVYTFPGITLVADEWLFLAASVPGNASTATGYMYRLSTGALTSGAVSVGSASGSPNRWTVGSSGVVGQGVSFADLRVYNKPLSRSAIVAMCEPHRRWDLYETPHNRIWVLPTAAGGGPLAVNVNLGSISYTGHQASVNTSSVTSVSLGSVAYTGQQATVATSRLVNVLQGVLQYSGPQTTVIKGMSVVVAQGIIAYTGQQSTLTTSRLVSVAQGSLAYTSYQADVSTGFDGVAIDGASTKVISTNYGEMRLYFNGSDYYTI